jgi:hypothetical protein
VSLLHLVITISSGILVIVLWVQLFVEDVGHRHLGQRENYRPTVLSLADFGSSPQFASPSFGF